MKDIIFEALLGSKIAYYRAIKGLTQAELGQKAGVSTAYISHIETGVKRPTFKLTVKIAKALSVDWRELSISPLVKKINSLDISNEEKEALTSVLGKLNNYL